MLVLTICLTVQIYLLVSNIRRAGFYPYPHGLMIYIISGQIALSLVAFGYIEYRFLKLYSSYYFVKHLEYTILGYFSLYLILFLVQKPQSKPIVMVSYKDIFDRPIRYIYKKINIFMPFVVFAIYFHHIMLYNYLDWNLVWRNNSYLLLGLEDVLLSQDAFPVFLQQSRRLMGMIAASFIGFFMARRNYSGLAILLPIVVFDFAYDLGAHSRATVVYVALVAFPLIISRRSLATVIVLFAVGAISFLSALGGRATGEHGLSSIINIFSVIYDVFKSLESDFILNIFEGVFVTSEIPLYISNKFSLQFMILSFSPFPSFIDGFNAIVREQSIFLHVFVPASALLEVSAFGPFFVAVYATIQLSIGKMTVNALQRRRDFAGMLANALMLMSAYIQFAYPIRNSLKYSFAVLAIIIGAKIYERFNAASEVRKGAQARTDETAGLPRGRGGRAGLTAARRNRVRSRPQYPASG